MSVDNSRIAKNTACLGLARRVRSRPRRRLGREALARGHRLERQDRAPVLLLGDGGVDMPVKSYDFMP